MARPPQPDDVDSARDTEIADTAAHLRLSVTRLARILRQESSAGFSPSQMSALAAIARHGPLTLGRLADHERVAPPSITRIVAKLEEAGLVTRQTSTTDRRYAEVALRPEGIDILEEARRRKNEWLTEQLRDLTAEDLRRLDDALPILEALTARQLAPESSP